MGLFSGIKKAVKKVAKGVKKVFKKAGAFVGKILGSKWGKALMLAAAVFTGGMAIAAGIGAFSGQAASATFLTKFVAGAKGFIGALMNPVGAGKGFFGNLGKGLGAAAEGAAQGQGIFNVGMQAGGVADTAAATVAGAPGTDAGAIIEGGGAANASTAGIAGPPVPAGGVAPPPVGAPGGMAGPPAPVPGGGGGAGGMLKSAAGKAYDFAKSSGGGKILSQAVGGYAQGAQQEEMLKELERQRRYYDDQWRDPRQQAILERAGSRRVDTPQGFLDRARRFDRETAPSGRTPTVSYSNAGA